MKPHSGEPFISIILHLDKGEDRRSWVETEIEKGGRYSKGTSTGWTVAGTELWGISYTKYVCDRRVVSVLKITALGCSVLNKVFGTSMNKPQILKTPRNYPQP
jgi:hypothetical protein